MPGARLWRLCLCAGLAFAPVFLAPPAAAQRTELRPLLDRLDRMERELNLLQRQVYQGRVTGGEPAATAEAEATGLNPKVAARMEVRINQLETELRTLTGKAEEISFALERLQANVEKLAGDVDLRLGLLEKAGAGEGRDLVAGTVGEGPVEAEAEALAGAPMTEAAGPGGPGAEPGTAMAAGPAVEAPPPPEEGAMTAAALPGGTPREQYDRVLAQLRQADYAAAERGLRAFIDAYPDDALAENAQYWLGETYYVRSDYANAAVVFAEGFQKATDGPKAPDNLLKLGMSLARLGETEKACKVLTELRNKFPDAGGGIHDRAAKEKTRIGCE